MGLRNSGGGVAMEGGVDDRLLGVEQPTRSKPAKSSIALCLISFGGGANGLIVVTVGLELCDGSFGGKVEMCFI